MNDFVSIKSKDIVTYKGKRYLVTNVGMSKGREIQVDILPLGNTPKTVSAKSISLAPEIEGIRKLRQDGKTSVKRLGAGGIAKKAWDIGAEKAKVKSVAISGKKPFTEADVKRHVKSAIDKYLLGNNQEIITQNILDDIVKRVAGSQGYLVNHYKRTKTNTKSKMPRYANWKRIATIAIKMVNDHNRMVIQDRRSKNEA